MRPLLLGHRGARASRQFPENTLESFELCLEHGCDGFEFDLRCTFDGVAVVCHDPQSEGAIIETTPAHHMCLPTLSGVLSHFSPRAFLDIELKVPGLELLLLRELQKNPPARGYVVSSFLPSVLATLHVLDNAIPLGILCETREQLAGWEKVSGEWLIPRFDLVQQELVEAVHAAGKRIMVWTVNREEAMRKFRAWGVDAIISDETELLVQSAK
jgi:glycerophosphoryl diester phosphodiesterase